MPAKSKAQQRFFGMVRAAQKGEMAKTSPEVSQAASSMSQSDVKKFAKTKHDGLPEKKNTMEDTSKWPSIKDAKPRKKTDVKYDPHMKVMAPQVKTEAMNFTEFCDSLCEPTYQVEGSVPRCPPGYIYDREKKDCVPKTKKDKIGPGKLNDKNDQGNLSTPHFNVWGKTGVNGDGYAYEEPAGRDINATHWDSH